MDLTRIETPSTCAASTAWRSYRASSATGRSFGNGDGSGSSQVRIDWFVDESAAKDARFDIQMQKVNAATSRWGRVV